MKRSDEDFRITGILRRTDQGATVLNIRNVHARAEETIRSPRFAHLHGTGRNAICGLVYVTALLLQNGRLLVQYGEHDKDALVLPNLNMAEGQSCATVTEDAIRYKRYG